MTSFDREKLLKTYITTKSKSHELIGELGLRDDRETPGRARPKFNNPDVNSLYNATVDLVSSLSNSSLSDLRVDARQMASVQASINAILNTYGPKVWGRDDRRHLHDRQKHPHPRYKNNLFWDIPADREIIRFYTFLWVVNRAASGKSRKARSTRTSPTTPSRHTSNPDTDSVSDVGSDIEFPAVFSSPPKAPVADMLGTSILRPKMNPPPISSEKQPICIHKSRPEPPSRVRRLRRRGSQRPSFTNSQFPPEPDNLSDATYEPTETETATQAEAESSQSQEWTQWSQAKEQGRAVAMDVKNKKRAGETVEKTPGKLRKVDRDKQRENSERRITSPIKRAFEKTPKKGERNSFAADMAKAVRESAFDAEMRLPDIGMPPRTQQSNLQFVDLGSEGEETVNICLAPNMPRALSPEPQPHRTRERSIELGDSNPTAIESDDSLYRPPSPIPPTRMLNRLQQRPSPPSTAEEDTILALDRSPTVTQALSPSPADPEARINDLLVLLIDRLHNMGRFSDPNLAAEHELDTLLDDVYAAEKEAVKQRLGHRFPNLQSVYHRWRAMRSRVADFRQRIQYFRPMGENFELWKDHLDEIGNLTERIQKVQEIKNIRDEVGKMKQDGGWIVDEGNFDGDLATFLDAVLEKTVICRPKNMFLGGAYNRELMTWFRKGAS